jgi:predicted solute-binding protein
MQKKIRVGAVSYLNTKPLIYGFEHGIMNDQIQLSLDYPSRLAGLMQKNKLDISLLPVASIPNIANATVFSDYCIASDKKVASVCLFSHVPIEEIQEVYLDYQSKTSVALFRILLRDYWNIRPSLLEADETYIGKINGYDATLYEFNEPMANAKNYGGRFMQTYIGSSFISKNKTLSHFKISAEYGFQLFYYYNGIQSPLKNSINTSISYTY